MRVFRRFNEFGVTLLIASHDIDLIDKLGCRRVSLADGRLEHDTKERAGEAAFIIERPDDDRWPHPEAGR
jgi:cell division transport system ATP-binding protein